MSIPAHLARHRRLLIVGFLSLLLHVLAIALVDPRPTPSLPDEVPRLAVRLAPTASTAPAATAGAPPQPAPKARPGMPVEPPPVQPARITPSRVRQALPATPASPAVTPASPADAAQPPAGTPARQEDEPARFAMPGQYRVMPPPPAELTYTVTRQAADGTSSNGGNARLAWSSDGNRYRLEMDGVLGTLESEGDIDDAGVAPRQAVGQLGAGTVTTRFDRETGTIMAGVNPSAYPLPPGSQDPASLFAQLAGMGRANPDQMQNVLEFWVGSGSGARIERYEVRGTESIATGAGMLDTVHLVRLGEAVMADGRGRVELWLAPERDWLPVQLRVTDFGGAVHTQTLATIAIAPASGF